VLRSIALTSLFLLSLPSAHAAEILVAAASDLAAAEAALRQGFEKATGAQVRFIFHASGMLARQIENGAPYDVYLSANERYVRQLVDAGELVGETVAVYAEGRLGLWSRDGSVGSLAELTGDRIRNVAIANPAHAPYGVAAKQAFESQGLWSTLEPKIVLAENVRQTYQYGTSGNADAIVTSWTLVFDQDGVMLPAEWHEPIRQAGGALRRSEEPELARRFLEYLLGPAGQEALRAHGLFPVNGL
jgi:molybdate transport system substrate-binding protein